MTLLIARMTLRDLMGQRRMLVMVALAIIPLAVANVFRLGGHEEVRIEFAAKALLEGLVTTGVLPVIGAVIGTSALGTEFENMTAIYLLSKPVSRAAIAAGKLLAAGVAVVVLVVPLAAAAGWVALGDPGTGRIVVGFAIALTAGSLAYTAVFLALSIVTGRALIIGMGYAFLWEGAITSLFAGTRVLSIRQYTLGLADALTNVAPSDFNAQLSGPAAIAGLVIACVGGFAVATWRLARWEARESP